MLKFKHESALSRRTMIKAVGTLAVGVAAPAFLRVRSAYAAFPDRPVKIVVANTPGGPSDLVGRMVSAALQESTGKTFIIENIGGAGGNIGMAHAAKSDPDGYTLLLATNAYSVNYGLYNKLPYDPYKDFVAVSELASSPNTFVVKAELPAKTMKEFVALVKANPTKYNYGSYGNATSSHIHGEMLNVQSGVDLMHVPYKGAAPLVTDLLGGQVTSAFVDVASIRSHLNSGKVKVLAVTGAQRFKILPDVPTMAELGYKAFEPYGWFGVFVPAGTPKEIVKRLSDLAYQAGQDAKVKQVLSNYLLEAPVTFEAAQTRMRNDSDVLLALLKDLNIRPE